MNRRLVLMLAVTSPINTKLAQSHSYKLGSVAIGHAWALPSRQADGQMFMPLINNGREPDRLVAARSSAAAVAELRRNNRYDDPPAAAFILLPSRPIPMRPTAFHLRLVGLAMPLIVGDVFNAILDFEIAGEIEISIHVENTPGT